MAQSKCRARAANFSVGVAVCVLLLFVGVVVGVLCLCRTVLISVEVSLTAYQIMMWRKKLTVIVINVFRERACLKAFPECRIFPKGFF